MTDTRNNGGPVPGTFEMACAPDAHHDEVFYKTVDATIVGRLAVHKRDLYWKISHVATGFALPRIMPDTEEKAIVAAKVIDATADWSQITRSDDPSAPNIGLPKEVFREAVLLGEEAMIRAACSDLTAHSPSSKEA